MLLSNANPVVYAKVEERMAWCIAPDANESDYLIDFLMAYTYELKKYNKQLKKKTKRAKKL